MQIMRQSFTHYMDQRTARLVGRVHIDTDILVAPNGPGAGIPDVGRRVLQGQVQGREHCFDSLPHLAALGGEKARVMAHAQIVDWLRDYGDGRGAGWRPGVTGFRVFNWLKFCEFILKKQNSEFQTSFIKSLARQVRYLAIRAPMIAPGMARFQALCAGGIGALSLRGMGGCADRLLPLIVQDIETLHDTCGRNPGHWVQALALLIDLRDMLHHAGVSAPVVLPDAIADAGRYVRGFRHADGSLPRFHGGGRGAMGHVDHLLARADADIPPSDGQVLGYVRAMARRVSVIVDAAPPPANGHASALAFEMVSARRPVVVSCGSGAPFGGEWQRAARATPSHSTLTLDDLSSARLAGDVLCDGPQNMPFSLTRDENGHRVEAGQDAWRQSHGLTHARTLTLSVDGRSVVGEDLLTTLTPDDENRFAHALARRDGGIPFVIRFHLHPDVAVDENRLILPSGEVWEFTHNDTAQMTVEPSVYHDNLHLRQLPTQQVVLSGRAMAYGTRIRWALTKSADTPIALRDVAPATAPHEQE